MKKFRKPFVINLPTISEVISKIRKGSAKITAVHKNKKAYKRKNKFPEKD